MPKIVDPDDLVRNTSVNFYIADTEARFVELSSSLDDEASLIPPLTSGSDSGVTGQCVYSFAKEQWKGQEDLIRIPFPFIAITKTQFDLINNWDWYNDPTRYLVRDAGWSVISGSVTTQEFLGIVTLGTLGATEQVYYQQSSSLEPAVDFKMSGSVNQAIQQYSASSVETAYDKRLYTKLFVREYTKTYDDASIQDDLAVVTQEYVVYSLPLQNAADLQITTTLEGQATGSPYDEVTIKYLTGSGFDNYADGETYEAGRVVYDAAGAPTLEWFITNEGGTTTAGDGTVSGNAGTATFVTWSAAFGGGQRLIGTVNYAFNTIVDAGVGKNNSAGQVYTRIQYELRTSGSIDDGDQFSTPHTGSVSDLLLSFLGDTLITADGVYVDNFQDADTNTIDFYDVSGSVRRFPFVSAGDIVFNDNLSNDAQAKYAMFFTDVPSGSFGSASALIVQDNTDINITGSVSGSGSVSFTFDYDFNAQGGRASGSNADITVVAIGLSTAQYVSATSTILRSKTNTITFL